MFNKDTFRLIKSTFNRFLSLTMIVLIGSGFLMGMTNYPIVHRESTDAYYDEYNFQDIQLYSQYGFSVEDYEVITKIPGVKAVFPSKMVDCRTTDIDNNDSVVRVSELSRNVNEYNLTEGRMPQKADECLMWKIEDIVEYNLGDKVIVDLGEDDINDYLTHDEYTIVGFVQTPEYMAKILGPSNYNNRTLDYVIYVPNANFKMDYYTTIFLTLEDQEKYIAFSKKYKDYVNSQKEVIENETYLQQSYTRDKLIEEAQKEIDKNEKLLETLRTEGQKQLDDAKEQLDEAAVMITVYEAQLDSLSMMMNGLQSAIKNDQGYIDEIYGNTVEFENDLNDLLSRFGFEGNVRYGSSTFDYLTMTYNQVVSQFNSARYQLNSAKKQYEDGLKEYQDGLLSFNKQMEDAEHELRMAKQTISELPDAEWILLDRSKQYSALLTDGSNAQMETIGTYLPIMFFLVAALVCLTTMKRLVDEQRGQIGIYVALGYSNSTIIMKYVIYALLASLLGGIIGTIIGNLLIPYIIYTVWRILYDSPEMILRFPIGNVCLSIFSFAILMCSLTAYIVYRSLQDTPANLMRPKAPKKAKKIILEHISFLWNNMSFTSKITARNIFRYKSRFFMTIIGIAGCTSLLALGFGVKDSVSDVVDIQCNKIFTYNYGLSFNSAEHIDENYEILSDNYDNEMVAKCGSFMTRVYFKDGDDTAHLYIVDPRQYSDYLNLYEIDKKTPIKMNNEGVVVSQRFSENHNIKVGDYLTIESADGIKADVMVSNICEMYFEHFIFISEGLYENAFDEKPVINTILVSNSNKASLMQDISRLQDYSSLEDVVDFTASFNKIIEAINYVIIVIILIAGALAFVVLINLSQVNISEREREIATLKVLGFNSHEVNMYIFKETLLLSMLGGLVGLPLGALELRMVMGGMSLEMIMFGLTIRPISYIYAYLITVIFTIIVYFLMKKPINNIDMIESLKSVE